MKYRELRIAWSVAWGFAYLILPALNHGYDYYPRKYLITPRQHFLLAFPALLLIAAPWLSRRFSLSTLLIAMTLVSVGMGLIIYVVRQ